MRLLVFFFSLLLASSAHAVVITKTDGTKLDGRIIDETSSYVMIEVVRDHKIVRTPVARNVIKEIQYPLPTTQPSTQPDLQLPRDTEEPLRRPAMLPRPGPLTAVPPRKTLLQQRMERLREDREDAKARAEGRWVPRRTWRSDPIVERPVAERPVAEPRQPFPSVAGAAVPPVARVGPPRPFIIGDV